MFYFTFKHKKNDHVKYNINYNMPRLIQQIVDGLMEKFKDEDSDTVFEIIEEMRNNIRKTRMELVNFDEKQEN